jgi:type II secretory pathway pseudopilin PulG
MRDVMRCHTTAEIRYRRDLAGVTLIELMVAVGLATVIIAIALPIFSDWSSNQRAKAAARSAADLFVLAHTEAIRTGNRHIVFFGNPGATDPSGNPVQRNGQWTPVLLIDDGPPDTSNCQIDAGEDVTGILPEDGLSWGVSFADARVASDVGGADFDPSPPPAWDGSTFADPTAAKANWVMFRPDGVPVGFTGAAGSCGTIGNLGSGGGALYITNGERDFGVVLNALGGVRLHVWVRDAGAWSG